MKKLLLILCGIALTIAATAQSITGIVKDEAGANSKAVTVSLLRVKDSVAVKFAATSEQGTYKFEQVPAGEYLIKTSHVGYTPSLVGPVTVKATDVTVPAISLTKMSADLAAVTVVSKRPIVEVRADKMIVNVEGTVNAIGNDALELLRKSPGVMVDKDDNVSLSGKNGVQIFIDGKPTPLGGADLANYLKSLQSDNIDALEIISNPGAKYEAAGNAGIINIKLKKNKSFGTNGSVSAGYNIGTYAKYNTGLTLNNRNAKTNVFGNYNYSKGLNLNSFNLFRQQGDTIFDQINRMKNYYGSHNFKAGIDFFVTPKKTLGFIVNGNISDNETNTSGPMSIIYKPTNITNRVLVSESINESERTNLNFNGNYRQVGEKGRELNIDADYGFYDNKGDQYQPNIYFDPTLTTKLYSNIYRMISPSKIQIAALKVDYEQEAFKGKLGYGGKLGYVKTDNDFSRYDVVGSQETLDKDRSNRFVYKENINAGYVNYNRAFPKKGYAIQLGVRVENTVSNGTSTGLKWNPTQGKYENYDSSLKRNYTDFFPSAAITFNKNPMSQINITYSRRIDRPVYQDLNPFEFKINDYTFMKGNTALRPQYTNSFGITHTYKYKLNTTLNYSHVKDIFAQIPDTTEKSKSFLTKRNLATQNIVSLNVSYPFSYKKYSVFANLNTNYSIYKADYGGGDRVIDIKVASAVIYMQHSYQFKKKTRFELSGFYSSPSVWQGVFKSKSMYGIDAGVQQTIMKGKGTFKASLSDIFRTMRWSGTSEFSGQTSTASGRWESRQFKLNFSYRFGSNKVKAARQRKTGVDDETMRASGGGGSGGMGGGQ